MNRSSGSRKLGHIIGMSLITLFALFVMGVSVMKGNRKLEEGDAPDLQEQPAAVRTQTFDKQRIEITDRYSGMIRPFEKFSYSFESPGLIETLGKNERGQDLDEGDFVKRGQTLAALQMDGLMAEREEVDAEVKFTQNEYERALGTRKANPGAITDAELQRRNKDKLVAIARQKSLARRIKNAKLVSTVDGIISLRNVNSGEIASMQQTAFEVIQVDRVLLSVGIPESKIQRILAREKNAARKTMQDPTTAPLDSSENEFRTYVRLLGSPRFGSDEPPPLIGEVYRVGQTSDENSGLFQVEVLINNKDELLRPGLIAIADIVVNSVEGYRIPLQATVVQNGKMYLFATEEKEDVLVARRFEIKRDNYEIQDSDVIIKTLPENFRNIVTAGQQLLVDGRAVRLVDDKLKSK